MKWISKKATKIDRTSKYQSTKISEDRLKAIKNWQISRKNSVADGDKLRAFRAVTGLLPWKQIHKILNITPAHANGVISRGVRLNPEALKIVDAKLKEEGIEIKQRKISFD